MFYYLLFQLLYNMCFDCIYLYVVQDEAAMGRWTPTASTNGQHQSLIGGWLQLLGKVRLPSLAVPRYPDQQPASAALTDAAVI